MKEECVCQHCGEPQSGKTEAMACDLCGRINFKMDLAQFDGHTPGIWRDEHGEIIEYIVGHTWKAHEQIVIDSKLAASAPFLLEELKWTRKENDELREKVRVLQEFYDITQGVMGMMERTLDGSITSTEWPFDDQKNARIPEGENEHI